MAEVQTVERKQHSEKVRLNIRDFDPNLAEEVLTYWKRREATVEGKVHLFERTFEDGTSLTLRVSPSARMVTLFERRKGRKLKENDNATFEFGDVQEVEFRTPFARDGELIFFGNDQYYLIRSKGHSHIIGSGKPYEPHSKKRKLFIDLTF